LTHSSSIYLAIEGIDGTGKTYVAKHIAEKFNFSIIREPSSGVIGNLIKENSWNPATDFFLFMADRASMLKEADVGGNIVSDRSLYSSFAYQGYYLKNSFRDMNEYYDFFMGTAKLLPLLPTHLFVLFCEVDVALERVTKRGEVSRFERREYLQGVQEIYFDLKKRMKNVIFIDSNGSLNDLYEEVDEEVTRLLRPAHPPLKR
jgi:dTMP kinase